MCKSIELLQDITSRDAYIQLIKTWMNYDTSLVALSRKSGRVVGVLICKINIQSELTNIYSRVQVPLVIMLTILKKTFINFYFLN